MHYTQTDETVEGREEFIRQNAVALVEEKERMIRRLRERVTKLEASCRSLRAQLKKNAK